jgi:ABC-2 type transport system permease protein
MRDVLLIARREFTERLRDKAFLISNVVIIAVLIVGSIVPAFLSDDDPLRLATVGEEAAAVGAVAQASQETFGVRLDVSEVPDRAAAQAAVEAGELDAVVLDARTVLVDAELPDGLEPVLTSAVGTVAVTRALAEAGVSPAQLATLRQAPELEVTTLSPAPDFDFGPGFLVGLASVGILYGLLILYGQWVAQGVVEEKASRVVEVLVSAVRPTRLLAGKILGLGALGLLQVLLLAGIGLGAVLLTGVVELPPGALATLALVVAWFVLGYALYATLFAVSGAIVSRVEDLNGTAAPIWVLIIGALFVAQFTASTPGSAASRIAGLVPFSAPLVQPLRMSSGAAEAWEVALAIVLTLALIALLVPLAARLYTGGVLQVSRKIGLRDAWRGTAG